MSGEAEDPVVLVMKAARDHLPVDPTGNLTGLGIKDIPDGNSRPSIEEIVDEILGAEDYMGQIVGRRIYEPKEPLWGEFVFQIRLTLTYNLHTLKANFHAHYQPPSCKACNPVKTSLSSILTKQLRSTLCAPINT